MARIDPVQTLDRDRLVADLRRVASGSSIVQGWRHRFRRRWMLEGMRRASLVVAASIDDGTYDEAPQIAPGG